MRDDGTMRAAEGRSHHMHRPDTIIEIHRERVQDQTVEMFSGDKYTQSVDGAGYSATATLDLTLDRVWFVLDSRRRLWQEEVDGELRDPLRHFAIDLAIFDSKIVIDSVTCIPLVSLPRRRSRSRMVRVPESHARSCTTRFRCWGG